MMPTLRGWNVALLATTFLGCASAPSHSSSASSAQAPSSPQDRKPRVVVTTDPELDDSNSLLRYLLYSTDFRTEGLVYASSQFHWKGDGTGKKFSVPEPRVLPLRAEPLPVHVVALDAERALHRRRGRRLRDASTRTCACTTRAIPTPAELRSKIRWGNVEFDGDISKDTPGSDLIRDLLLDDEPEPDLSARLGRREHDRARAEVDPGAVRVDARVARHPREGLAQGDPLALRRSGRHLRQLHPPQLARHPLAARGAGWRRRRLRRVRLRVGRERAVLQRGLDARRTCRATGRSASTIACGATASRWCRATGTTTSASPAARPTELRAKGYVVWLPPRPKGEFLGEGDTFTYLEPDRQRARRLSRRHARRLGRPRRRESVDARAPRPRAAQGAPRARSKRS